MLKALMDKIKRLEKQHPAHCPPGFFTGMEENLDGILAEREGELLRRGFTPEQIKNSPVFIEGELA